LKPRTACLALLLAVGLGTGLAFLRAPERGSPSAPPPATPARAKQEPRRDRSSDPVPPGAVARLGTLRFRVPGEIEGLAFSPDGKTIAASSNGGVNLLDAASGKLIQRLPSSDFAFPRQHPVVFSPDGKRLAGRGQISVGRPFKGGVPVCELTVGGKPRDYDAEHALWVGWSAGGEPLAVCLETEGVRFHELASGRSRRFACKDLKRPELHAYVACTCSARGQTLAVADERSLVHVWDTATGRERCTLKPEGEYVQCLSLSPDGRILLTVTRKTAQLWD